MEALPLGSIAATPWDFSPAWFAAVAFVLPAIAWAACAWRRAFEQDPNRLRRSGIRELRRVLVLLRRSRGAAQPAQLHAWRRAAARTWAVASAAPTGDEVVRAQLAITGDSRLAAEWADLWHATERQLFGAGGALPDGWVERASAVAAKVEVPKRERWVPDRLNDWVPVLATAVLALAVIVPGWAAVDGAPKPDPDALEGIERAAAAALAANWNDSAAHHNLALARIAREDWNRAVGHALAAFAQAPGTQTRAALRIALQENERAARDWRPLVQGAWHERAAAWLSAATWQRIALGASVLLALVLSGVVVGAYAAAPAWRAAVRRWHLAAASGAIASFALLAFGAAVAGWAAYGALHQSRAAVVVQATNLSPVPTDLVPEEETAPLVAGAVVLQKKTFLGWQQVESPEGVRGWVRRSAVLPVYATR